MNLKLITLSNLIKFKELLTGIINNKISELNTEINTKVSELNTEINTKVSELNTEINTKVSELNTTISTGLATKSDTGHRHDNATTSKDGFMSSSDKVKLNGIATGATNTAAPVNADWNATSGLAQILNKPDIVNYTGGKGIDITDGVISIVDFIADTTINSTVYTAPGYTLYGDYFLSNTLLEPSSYREDEEDDNGNITYDPRSNWEIACDVKRSNITVTETITITDKYMFAGNKTRVETSTKTVTAKTLSKKELETVINSGLTAKQIANLNNSFWTSTFSRTKQFSDNKSIDYAYSVENRSITEKNVNANIYICLGFKNPFA